MSNKNGWICTDDDYMQYCKKIGKNKFKFVEKVWLDLCRDDEGYPDKAYTVKSALIDLNDYTKDDIKTYITGYYHSLDELKEMYGNDSNQIIAECIFEQMNDGSSTVYGKMTDEEANQFIQIITEKC